jgi:hypothetical protein
MVFGELSTGNNAVPQSNPPYHGGKKGRFNCNVSSVEYYTRAEAAKKVVPDIFELEDEPLCKSSVIYYPMSNIGSYSEYIHQIEVKWKGQKYDYYTYLVLDNESAIFAGREQWGIPKVFGNVKLLIKTGNHLINGVVERPIGERILRQAVAPENKIPAPDTSSGKCNLGFQSIPGVFPGSDAVLKQVVAIRMNFFGGECYTGKGYVEFCNSDHLTHPFNDLPVVRYGPAVYWENCEAVLYAEKTWNLLDGTDREA